MFWVENSLRHVCQRVLECGSRDGMSEMRWGCSGAEHLCWKNALASCFHLELLLHPQGCAATWPHWPYYWAVNNRKQSSWRSPVWTPRSRCWDKWCGSQASSPLTGLLVLLDSQISKPPVSAPSRTHIYKESEKFIKCLNFPCTRKLEKRGSWKKMY